KDFAKAFEKAQRASRIAPFDPSIRELAATVVIQAKDFGAARRHIEALIAIEPDRSVHRKRLEALEKLAQ
ncbi:MAG: hypothetical protein L6Q35_08360, partial [Phycisphaerales bacterium]|nr:hypothetical protein [Phycisphaerales bacterium]